VAAARPNAEPSRPAFALFGDPVAQSRSPALHEAGLVAWGRPGIYLAVRVSAGAFARAVRSARDLGFRGANVTVPHKRRALDLVDRAGAEARRIGAANVLCLGGGGVTAYNTDGAGFLDGLREIGRDAFDRAVVLGGGGAARAVVDALGVSGTAGRIVWVSRRPAGLPAFERVRPTGWDAVPRVLRGADLLVNATPVGMDGGPAAFPAPVDPEDLAPGGAVVDLTYGPRPSALLERARAAGLAAQDGRPMLLHQAVRAQALWWNEPVPPHAVAAMRAVLDGAPQHRTS